MNFVCGLIWQSYTAIHCEKQHRHMKNSVNLFFTITKKAQIINSCACTQNRINSVAGLDVYIKKHKLPSKADKQRMHTKNDFKTKNNTFFIHYVINETRETIWGTWLATELNWKYTTLSSNFWSPSVLVNVVTRCLSVSHIFSVQAWAKQKT